jgi:hypothetical protein
MENETCKKIKDEIFKKSAIDIKVFLRAVKTKGANYDKFRNTGYQKEIKNSIYIKAVTKQISPNSLIIREMGLTESGAMMIIVEDSKVPFLTLSERICINNEEYYVFNDNIGSKMQVFSIPFGYSKIMIFRKDK